MSFHHWSKEDHGFRYWWHSAGRSVFRVEMAFLRSFCHFEILTHDSEWTLALALPGIALWLTLDGFGLWHPSRLSTFTPGLWLPDDRQFEIGIRDWALKFAPWARSMEWNARDPWWVRGITTPNLPNLLLGRTKYTLEILKSDIPLQIPLPEGTYNATAKIERRTWKRPLWFPKRRTYVAVDVPKGLPFAGKGENSWDCGDDGLFGYAVEGTSIEHAIAHGVDQIKLLRTLFRRSELALSVGAVRRSWDYPSCPRA